MFGRFDPDQELDLAQERACELRAESARIAQPRFVADGRRWETAVRSGGLRVRLGRILVGIGEAIAGQPA